jgi:hypothetical protein
MASYMISYRSDGRSRVTPTGQETVGAENWPRMPARAADRTGDCDDSAIYVHGVANAIIQASFSTRNSHEYIRAAHNILVPHYTVGMCVLSAKSPEATGSAHGSGGASVAGHAATMLIPTVQFLAAQDVGTSHAVLDVPAMEPAARKTLANAKFNALFPDHVMSELPTDEQATYNTWECAKVNAAIAKLEPFAIEGTTPAAPTLYETNSELCGDDARRAKRDQAVFSKVGDTIGRSIKTMHVGQSTNVHQFYERVIEFNVPRSHPLWTNDAVRELNAASTQYCLADMHTPKKSVGASPRELVKKTYAAIPLVSVNKDAAETLDVASKVSDADIMPPVNHTWQLTAFETERLNVSMEHLRDLNTALPHEIIGDNADNYHSVSYVLSLNSLVHNPVAVNHFCSRIKTVAHAGVVDELHVDKLVTSHDDNDVGKMIIVTASVLLE